MKVFKALAIVSILAFMAVSCGRQEETPAPGTQGADTTMTETMPDTTGTTAPDTTGVR